MSDRLEKMTAAAKRIGLFMRRDLRTQWRSGLIQLAAVSAIVFVIILLTAWQGNNPGILHSWLFPLFYLIIGYVLTGQSFSDLHKKDSTHQFLMLPVSAGEKVVSRLLFTGIGYTLIFVAGYWITSLLGWMISRLLFENSVPLFRPFAVGMFRLYGKYLVTQGIFFLGAAWFRKHSLFKTVLLLFGLAVLLALWGLLGTRILFWELFTGKALQFNTLVSMPGASYTLMNIAEATAQIMFWAFLAPFCWIMAWFRVKEAEVHHGV